MTLPPPTAERTLKHVRSVQLGGYKRSDGRWDIEARLTDVKDQDYLLSSGLRKRGEAVHDMWLRVTIDSRMGIVDAVASTDAMPYVGHCDRITPAYRQLIGLNLFHGFRTAVKTLFRSTRGCSHLSELAMFLPTAALQTFASDVPDNDDSGHKPYQLDRCHALESHSDAVRQYYPRWYRGQKPG
ncbi:MAG TPA: DUF2889 domain-containing protein [Accumulibacter sp.]|uniref:DUF2889 domain-containing protein n=1 Tax=Accumulibacter sp. TaxID=2053492 RepID=UPI0026124FA5|nr:DUF2889 domain-containing protein [Accumulibacter sp.]MDS4055154.1 DUF2889 domain-containing protein [Accumulibacter sp.]HMW63650.1 DUF2889 domain-containing protein [Accumulibacter sp.]HMW81697.1 DUF2889 domain-containing protein [Accumulibacter sp.]HMX67840.1 DUF2889 domain-containing protein [Accumulibacter sp.]HNB69194.1 DUF2889 domain-containing protein [Accumulibacter sp.]